MKRLGLGIAGDGTSGSATRVLISMIHLREIVCEDGRWMKMAQDRVQWQGFVSAALNLRILLPQLVN
jgi:hypothetical protein